MRRISRRHITLGAGVTALALTLPSLTAAQSDEPVLLDEGPWTGHMSLTGTAVGTMEGAPVEFRTDVDGFFEIVIGGTTDDDDREIGNEAAEVFVDGGSWTLDGSWQFDAVIPGAGTGTVDAFIDAEGGFEGAPSAPLHTGSAVSGGTITAFAAGQQRTIPLPAQTSPISLEVRLESSSCYEVYGDVSITLTELIEAQGLDAAFVGPWAAYRNTQDISAAINTWVSEMRGIGRVVGEPVEFPPNTPDVVRMFGELLQQYNDWVDMILTQLDEGELPQGSDEPLWQQTADMINDHAVFLARLRNLTECEAEILDPELIERFDTLIKRALLLSAEALVQNAALDIDKLTVLTKVALFSGALGASGPQPDAARVEEALRLATEAIIAEAFISGADDGSGEDGIDVTDVDAVKALALATSMRWTINLGGTDYEASRQWENYEAKLAEGGEA